MVKAKNNEVSAFIEMIDNGSLPQDSIFYADAINTTAKMIEFLNSRHLDYIMAVKNQPLKQTCSYGNGEVHIRAY